MAAMEGNKQDLDQLRVNKIMGCDQLIHEIFATMSELASLNKANEKNVDDLHQFETEKKELYREARDINAELDEILDNDQRVLQGLDEYNELYEESESDLDYLVNQKDAMRKFHEINIEKYSEMLNKLREVGDDIEREKITILADIRAAKQEGDEHENILAALRAENVELSKKLHKMNSDRSASVARKQELRAKIVKLDQVNNQLLATIDSKAGEKANLSDKIKVLTSDLKIADQNLKRNSDELDSVEEQKDSLKQQAANLENLIHAVRDNVCFAEIEERINISQFPVYQEFKEALEKIFFDSKAVQIDIEKVRELLKVNTANFQEISLQFNSSVAKLEQMKVECEKVKEQHRGIQENLEEAKGDIGKSSAFKIKLEARLQKLQSEIEQKKSSMQSKIVFLNAELKEEEMMASELKDEQEKVAKSVPTNSAASKTKAKKNSIAELETDFPIYRSSRKTEVKFSSGSFSESDSDSDVDSDISKLSVK